MKRASSAIVKPRNTKQKGASPCTTDVQNHVRWTRAANAASMKIVADELMAVLTSIPFSDCTIRCGEYVFPAHRCILASRIPFFHFQDNNAVESSSLDEDDTQRTVTLSAGNQCGLRLVLFAYTDARPEFQSSDSTSLCLFKRTFSISDWGRTSKAAIAKLVEIHTVASFWRMDACEELALSLIDDAVCDLQSPRDDRTVSFLFPYLEALGPDTEASATLTPALQQYIWESQGNRLFSKLGRVVVRQLLHDVAVVHETADEDEDTDDEDEDEDDEDVQEFSFSGLDIVDRLFSFLDETASATELVEALCEDDFLILKLVGKGTKLKSTFQRALAVLAAAGKTVPSRVLTSIITSLTPILVSKLRRSAADGYESESLDDERTWAAIGDMASGACFW